MITIPSALRVRKNTHYKLITMPAEQQDTERVKHYSFMLGWVRVESLDGGVSNRRKSQPELFNDHNSNEGVL